MSQFKTAETIRTTSGKRLPTPMHVPWHVTRLLDRRALRHNIRGVLPAPASVQVERFLVNRAGDARDLFALRGVRTRRSTVFQLMSRSIAADVAANDNGPFAGRGEVRHDEARLVPPSLLAALR